MLAVYIESVFHLLEKYTLQYTLCSRPKIGDDGTVDLKAKDLSLRQTLSVRNDGNGQLAVQAHDCSFDVSGISVKFHGGARLAPQQTVCIYLLCFMARFMCVFSVIAVCLCH